MGELRPRIIEIDLESGEYQRLLKDNVDSVAMHSGFVTLKPGSTVGRHSTGNKEEIILILEGEGKFVYGNGEEMAIKYGTAAYCPPNIEHDIVNTGANSLKYIYVVSKV